MQAENRPPIPATPQAEPARLVNTPSDALAPPAGLMPPQPSPDDRSSASAWAGMVEYASWFAYSA